ncbi:MAG: glycoside hydrolase family 9 protein [Polyangiaceae bacterium]|nr:glycoside hydrolase family 9 protein [Polyangiaceae bacterium]
MSSDRPRPQSTPFSASILGAALLATGAGCASTATPPSVPAGNGSEVNSGGNLVRKTHFEDGRSLPWVTSFTRPASGEALVKEGALCLRVDHPGKNPWDAQLRHREMIIQMRHAYTVSFLVWADRKTKGRVKIGMSGPPYAEYWSKELELGPEPRRISEKFGMLQNDDPTAEFAFHLGGEMAGSAPVTVCIDRISLVDPEFVPAKEATDAPVSPLHVNQLGYFPHLSKHATLASDATQPLAWELVDQSGVVVHSGKTRPLGHDTDAGQRAHDLDFSAFSAPGHGYRLRVGEHESPPFEIGTDLYAKLKYDALAYFYLNRSGIEIAMPYAGQAQWTRAVGHPSDTAVPCASDIGCAYSLDVSGGWYDAGDYGKYVVNAGLSVWLLLNQYERATHLGRAAADFGDGKLRIPEAGNGAPDLLDEARWEIEWMLRMQVPDGQPNAGMAHHKMHDEEWTGLAVRPIKPAEVRRVLRPVSTAATLNLAAIGAMAARVYPSVDSAFADRCLEAAERAWTAATTHPVRLAAPDDLQGGGAYGDEQIDDESYWAAAELFVTTGKAVYGEFLQRSPFYRRLSREAAGVPSTMSWATTDALGTISLALVPHQAAPAEVQARRALLVQAGDEYLSMIERQPYRLPYEPGSRYPWGSNAIVLNNAIILAVAHDFSGEQKYLDGAVQGMDYLLGRNPVDQCYVSGYGFRPLRNPHHRFWSKQANPEFPEAPPGAISGGPNSDLQDPYAKAGLFGCAPQTCFMDHIEAYSLNEVAINWNAALAWLAAFLDEAGGRVSPTRASP